MKRGGPLERKTPLDTRSELKRSAPLRATPLPRPAGDDLIRAARMPARQLMRQARPRVSREEREGRRLLARRSGNRCEIGAGEAATEAHHRRNRSQGGTWQVSNLLHLCSAHHQYVTTHPQAAREQGWAVPSTRKPGDVPAFLYGREWSALAVDGSVTPINDPNEESA